MKKRWLGLRVLVSMCAALGWWGLLYPELTLTPDTVKVYEEDGEGNLTPLPREWSFDGDLFRDLLWGDQDKITFRSKLLTNLGLFRETFQVE